jgi:hypothetical protein
MLATKAEGMAIAPKFAALHQDLPATPIAADDTADSVLSLRSWKPYLNTAIPYYSRPTLCWEPVLQWSEQMPLPLWVIRSVLQELLALFNASSSVSAAPAKITCGAVGLDQLGIQTALRSLVGVAISCPAGWSDAYRNNVRSAILATALVKQPAQIVFLEDAIAALLSGFPDESGRPLILPHSLPHRQQLPNIDWQGVTLVINVGATVSELAIVDLPEQLQNVARSNFHSRSFDYAGNAIDQDIICQLIYPAWMQQTQRLETKGSEGSNLAYTFGRGEFAKSGTFVDGWHWQPHNPEPQHLDWENLGLERLILPSPGEPDRVHRHLLQQHLNCSPFGQGLLEAARQLKLSLQHQDRFTLRMGNQTLTITRQDLGSRVFLPYVQRLNRELNALLSQMDVSISQVKQVLCTGGTASLGAIARWLRQKLPNATIIQDTYNNLYALSTNSLLTCSRVAYGLAVLWLYPDVLQAVQTDLSDYSLLLALIKVFADQPLTVETIMQQLEQQGICTPASRSRILAFLEGQLPPGLVFSETERSLLTQDSQNNPDYAKILAAPLFYKLSPQTYLPNPTQRYHLEHYLEALMATIHSTLDSPV